MGNKHTPSDDTKLSEIIQPNFSLGIFSKLKASVKAGFFVFSILSDKKQQEKLYRLSRLRAESMPKSISRVLSAGFQLIPTNLDLLDFPKSDVVDSVEKVSHDTYKIQTDDGTVFYDWGSSKKHASMYWLMRDQAKKHYNQETYFSASAVNRSYIHGTSRFPGDVYIPGNGGVVIEAGAYVGYKAIKFAKQVGETGKVLVIEASPDNFSLLKKNISENGLSDIAYPINCAVSDKDAVLPLMSKTRMKHTIVDTDELPFDASNTIEAKSLDTIIDEHNLTHIDFLNLQLNGAEIEAIEGLKRNFHKVRYINIVSRHHREGVLVVDIAKKLLMERGCEIIVDSRSDRLYNLTVKVRSR